MTTQDNHKEQYEKALERIDQIEEQFAALLDEHTEWGNIIERLHRDNGRLKSELAALRDPWTRIEPDRPETLPPQDVWVLLTLQKRNGEWYVDFGYYENYRGIFYDRWDNPVIDDVVAWQPWPDPAPYEVKE